MIRLISQIFIIITIVIAVFTLQAYAEKHTFSIYGTINDYDGKPIVNATLGIIEPVNNTFYDNVSWIQSTVTDENGYFRFTNVSTESDKCGIMIKYPDNMQYYNPANSFRIVMTSGVQIVNITRDTQLHDEVPTQTPNNSTLFSTVTPLPTPFTSGIAILFIILVTGLICLCKK